MDRLDDAIAKVESLYQAVTRQPLPITNGTPYAPLLPERDPEAQVAEQIDRLMRALDNNGSPQSPQHTPWVPPMQLWENEKEYLLRVDLPGLQKNEIDIECRGNMLIIRGERMDTTTTGYKPLHVEAVSGRFERTAALPIQGTLHLRKL